MEVNYNKKNNTLIIEPKIYETDYVRKLPNRKYSTRLKAWTAPCIRFNAKHIKDNWYNLEFIRFSIEAKNAIEQTLDILKIVKKDFPNSYPYKMKPRDYQKKGLDFIYSLTICALYMATGSGKSKTVIDKLACHYIEGKIDSILMVCPCSIRQVWITQFKEHCPIGYDIIIAELKTEKNLREINEFIDAKTNTLKVIVVGIESLQLEKSKAMLVCKKYMEECEPAVVVDEAHDIKNPTASRSKNLFKITRNAPYRIVMTGTPVSQGILDLYGLFNFLDPNIIGIGDFWSFKNRYSILEEMQISGRSIKKVVGPKNVNELMEIIKPFTYQVTKNEAAAELPDKIRLCRYVNMTKEQQKIYNDIRIERVTEIDKAKKEQSYTVAINNVLAAYTALQQICGGFVSRKTGVYKNNGDEIRETIEVVKGKNNPKILEIKRVIDELDDSEQIIIWCKFRSEAFCLAQELKGYRTDKFKYDSVVYLDKTAEQRISIEEQMNNKEIRYFISTPNSGGTGLTMNTCAYVIYFSNSQRLLFREQSEDRCHRIGQQRNVTYIDIIMQNTVDEKIIDSLKNKKDLSEYVKTCLGSKIELL